MGNAQTHFEVPDSWGLAGKVAVVTGGGAAGDGIGNGRASAILLSRAGTRAWSTVTSRSRSGRSR